jgi:hypothetical protein
VPSDPIDAANRTDEFTRQVIGSAAGTPPSGSGRTAHAVHPTCASIRPAMFGRTRPPVRVPADQPIRDKAHTPWSATMNTIW